MNLFQFPYKPIIENSPEKLESELQEELRLLHGVAVDGKPSDFHEIMPVSMMHMARIMAILSRKAEIQSGRIVRLTWGLFWLTAMLAVITIIQIAKGH